MATLLNSTGVIDVWLVFENRVDYPGKFKAERREYWEGELFETNEVIYGDSLIGVSMRIPAKHRRIQQHEISPLLQGFDGLVEAWL